MTAAKRHRWGEKLVHPYKTERECLNGCGIVKVSRREHRLRWTEYWRGLDKIAVNASPPCEQGRQPRGREILIVA
jgi:hypothetical protein